MRRRIDWKSLLLVVGLLLASLRPAHGAAPRAGVPAEDAPACCAEPEGCCPADEHDDRSQGYVPICCGVDAPASTPAEPAIPAARTLVDPTESVLRSLAAGVKQLGPQACWIPRPRGASLEPAEHGPPGLGGAAPPRGCHWLTERELRLALALLSVARI
jgi:hypothetical protein